MFARGFLTTSTTIGEYRNPLYSGSYRDHKATVELLVDGGTDINTQEGYHRNALQIASCHGYKAIVKLLADGGVDVNTQGGLYGNLLQAASYGAIVRWRCRCECTGRMLQKCGLHPIVAMKPS